MRNGFLAKLVEAAGSDDRIMLLNGDLGFSVLEPFAAKYPDRYINAGIAEQTMAGVAAGLAMSGRKVFTYSIANFAVTRCLEQIRNDVCYHKADVTVVAVGGGLPYGSQGYTHFGVEDVAFMRALPDMKVYAPADRIEMAWCMEQILSQGGPAYLRLARGGEPDLHKAPLSGNGLFEVKAGQDIAIVAQGTILGEALKAAEGGEAAVYSLPALNADTAASVRDLAGRYRKIVTVEEHVREGGMGGFAAEILSGEGQARLTRLGVRHEVLMTIGDQPYLRGACGIDAAGIARALA